MDKEKNEKSTEEKTMKQYRAAAKRHVLKLEADVTEQQRRELLHMSNLLRIAGNELIAEMRKNLEQLKRTKKYREYMQKYLALIKSDDNVKKTEEYKKKKEILTAELKTLQEKYNITKEFCYKKMKMIKNKYNITAVFVQTKAEDIWYGVERCLYGNGKSLHFKKRGEWSSVRAKQASRGIVAKLKDVNGKSALMFKLGKIEFGLKVKKNDLFAEAELELVRNYFLHAEEIDKQAFELYKATDKTSDTFRLCFISLSFKEIRGKVRVFVHITLEGKAKPKLRKDGRLRHTYGQGTIGCDIGTQSIAYTSVEEVGLKNLAERGTSIKKREAKEAELFRRMDESRRATNPENYNADGTVRKGKKSWKKSRHYKELQKQYRNISRIATENRHLAINEEVNRLRSLGDVFITEPQNAKALQKCAQKTTINPKTGRCNRKKRFGKSVKNRCPGYFLAKVKAKFQSTGGRYIEVAKDFRASQYDHTCDKYIKKELSDRMFNLSDGTRVQRDWYSSFLLYCAVKSGEHVNKSRCKKEFKQLYTKYIDLENYIRTNHINVMNSGIKIA